MKSKRLVKFCFESSDIQQSLNAAEVRSHVISSKLCLWLVSALHLCPHFTSGLCETQSEKRQTFLPETMKRFILILVLIAPAIYTCYDIQDVKAGDDVTLKCVVVSRDIRHLEWTRLDILDGSVFYYQNNKVKETYMDPRFQGRVMLKHPQTAHIVVGNVTVSDSGTYKCWVKVEENRRKKRAAGDQRGPPDSVVKLTVTDGHHGEDGGSRDGGSRFHGGGIAAVVAGVVVIVAVVGVLVFHRKRLSRDRPPGDLLN